jgi:N-methylhydantoinase A
MHTIGAGGGSIAWLDEGQMLQVGPQSAGADPGPACYQLGGNQPTVTDANLLLGHLPSNVALGGRMALSIDHARAAIKTIADTLGIAIEQAALGIIDLANEHMARALRVISIEKGHDPEDHALISFGGAGGLHVCALAEALNMSTAIVPVHAGVLSAFGMLVAPRGRQFLKTFRTQINDLDLEKAEAIYRQMLDEGVGSLEREGIEKTLINSQRHADLRYVGQSSTLRVDWQHADDMITAFHALHKQRYGHQLDEPVELVNLRLSVQAPGHQPVLPKIGTSTGHPVAWQRVHGETSKVPVYDRSSLGAGQQLPGPALVIEPSATTWISADWMGTIDPYGNLILSLADTMPA